MTTTTTSPPAAGVTVRTTGLRRRLFARIWNAMDDPVDEQIRQPKDELLVDLPPQLVEIGPGRGSNFKRYRNGTHVRAIEPNTHLHPALASEAEQRDIDVTIHAGDLRQLALPDGSQELVVSTLTLCSVDDREGLVEEIRRILGTGGRFIFIEHVAEQRRSRRLLQHVVRRPWRVMFDDCDPRADTDAVIARAGFESVVATTRNLGPGADPTNLTHWGIATK